MHTYLPTYLLTYLPTYTHTYIRSKNFPNRGTYTHIDILGRGGLKIFQNKKGEGGPKKGGIIWKGEGGGWINILYELCYQLNLFCSP